MEYTFSKSIHNEFHKPHAYSYMVSVVRKLQLGTFKKSKDPGLRFIKNRTSQIATIAIAKYARPLANCYLNRFIKILANKSQNRLSTTK